jgi:DNA polymerase I-like protein with 3'-5' exonuclease and polymerase domains
MSIIFFDTETTGLDPFIDRVTLIQIKQDKKIRLNKIDTTGTIMKIKEVKDLLENSLVVGHNLKFDLKFIKHHFDIEPTNLFDTYIAEILISGGQKVRQKGTATLEAVTKQYTGIQLNKSHDVRLSFNGGELTQEQIKYAAMDVAVLPEIHKKQQEQLKALGLEKVFEIEMGCIPATVWLELSGLPLDMGGLNRVKGETKQKIEDSKLKVKTFLKESGYKNMDLFGLPAVNLDSPIQLLEAMKVIGLKISSTGDDVLSGIVHPIGKAIKEYRKQQKLLTGFILKYPGHLNKVTRRIQPAFNQVGTNTGRFTSSKPNMQQVPHDKSIRALFKAGKGKKIVTADYSQIELRIIAEVSQEPKFLEIYKNNRDLHRLTASLVLNKPESEITKEERQQAKAINFGFAYGLGAQSFKEKTKNDYDIDISIEQAQEFRDTFFKNYPVLAIYLQTAAGTAAQLQQIRNKSGRIVRFDSGLEDWQYENMGRNTPIQSLSADITKTAMGRLYHKLKPFNAKLINAVHDELVFEVQEDRVTEAAQVIKDEMEAAGSEYLKSIPCIVEVVMGESWQK